MQLSSEGSSFFLVERLRRCLREELQQLLEGAFLREGAAEAAHEPVPTGAELDNSCRLCLTARTPR